VRLHFKLSEASHSCHALRLRVVGPGVPQCCSEAIRSNDQVQVNNLKRHLAAIVHVFKTGRPLAKAATGSVSGSQVRGS
jgi:hypothetical protein